MTNKTEGFKPGRDLPYTRETKARLEAIKKAADKRGVSQAQLVRRGLTLAAPELKEIFTEDIL